MLKSKHILKLDISKLLPINLSVNDSVIALMTNKNSPSDNIVTGNVNNIKIGFTIIFSRDKTALAPIAAPIPDK